MKRLLFALSFCLGLAMLCSVAPAPTMGKTSPPTKPKAAKFPVNFKGGLTGDTVDFSPAGMEPDFDLVNRVIIKTYIHTKHLPPVALILDAYLENFQSDTQPLLPDLIHPNVPLQTTLGGFFSGEALIVDRENKILYMGEILAEALIDPNCLFLSPNTKHPPSYCLSEQQHMIVDLVGQGAAKGSYIDTRSWFIGNSKLQVTGGKIYGEAHIPAKARKLLAQGPGNLTTKEVLADFDVQFPHQRGLNTGQTGPRNLQCFAGHCINPANPPTTTSGTGGPTTLGVDPNTAPSQGIRWTTILGFTLIGLALILLVVYFWQGHREKQQRRAAAASSSG